MLFRSGTLERISKGEVTLAFRKWKRPTVKTGGTLQTRIGVLNIHQVKAIEIDEISEHDARRAGNESLSEVLSYLGQKAEGQVYRVEFTLGGADPRIALRNADQLSEDDIDAISKRLDRWDRASKNGPWTGQVLSLIKAHPGMVSTELAEQICVERYWLKGNIRKLKGLGLTISLGVGYKLSPRGEAYLKGSDV